MLVDLFNIKSYIKDHDDKLNKHNKKLEDNAEDLKALMNSSMEVKSHVKDLEFKIDKIDERLKEKPVEFCSYDAYRAEYERTKKEV